MRKALLVALGLCGVLALLVGMTVAAIPSPQAPQGTTATSCTVNATGQLTAAEVAEYAQAAGFSATAVDAGSGLPDLVVITAISMPESGANTSAVQQGQPAATTGVGLFQITPGTTADRDPTTNAKDAYAKFLSQGFDAWTTYTGGAYRAWVAWAQAGVAEMSASGACKGAALAVGPAGAVGQVTPEAVPAGLASLASFDGFPAGQCTIFAAWEFTQEGHTVNWSGNADQWSANAAAAGHQETMTPTDGAVVVYGSGGGYSVFGHVAIVIAVQGEDFQVAEMNYLGAGQVDDRWSDMTDVAAFIVS